MAHEEQAMFDVDKYGRLIPPNPYDNLPPVGSTEEFYKTEGDWALLTADYLRRREEWLKFINQEKGESDGKAR